MVGMCTPSCIKDQDLCDEDVVVKATASTNASTTYSTTAGNVTAPSGTGSECVSSKDCSVGTCARAKGGVCAAKESCDADTGFTSLGECPGVCTSVCDRFESYISEVNSGTCTTADDKCSEPGYACIEDKSCRKMECDNSKTVITSAIKYTKCYGFCRPVKVPAMDKATFSNDYRYVTISLEVSAE